MARGMLGNLPDRNVTKARVAGRGLANGWTSHVIRTSRSPMNETRTTSRHIVLTGVSRGLGAAMLHELVERGHCVSACARSQPAIESLRQQYGAPHSFDCVDVSDFAQVEQWSQRVLSKQGVPDLLVNNAALINANNTLWDVPVAEFATLTQVNLNGVFHTIKAFVPGMIANGSGIIVNLSSTWGRMTSPEVAPYCATKWGIEGLTRALAQELPRGMAAIPLNPGIIHTDMLRSCFGEQASAYPSPRQWAQRAVPFILNLSAADNGRPLDVPG